jgi:tripartite-type tricarboxylate transporter receptor subunit TctC
MKTFIVGLIAVLAAATAAAQEPISFQGKSVTMIVGSAPGGGTDAFGRLAAPFFANRLPGSPSVVVRNVPGADGITAMNYMAEQIAPDGMTLAAAANTTADPLHYRKSQSHFDPTTFAIIGGAGRGSEALLINREAAKRLWDKQAPPVIMGAPGGVPRSGMQMTALGVAFLGWNVKWVVGYRGTNELMLALESGEIDMTSTGNLFQIQRLIDTGKFRILVQSGTLRNGSIVPRSEFGDAPVMTKLLDGKINDPLAMKALDYWSSIAVTDKWLALPPKTPQPIVDAYRTAYDAIGQDPEFIQQGKRMSDDFQPLSSSDVETLIRRLGSLSPQAIDYMTDILHKQGLETQ